MKVLLVFAHPDDETFNIFGTIKLLSMKGAVVKLILATKGEDGLLGTPPRATRKTITKVREKELRSSAKLAGISGFYFLGFKDGLLADTPLETLKSKILDCFKKERPNVVITFEKNGIFMHPDHKTISRATTEIFFDYMKNKKQILKLYHVCLPKSYLDIYHKAGFLYDHYGKMRGTPDKEITTSVDVTSVYKTKMKAMRCHKTQEKDCEMLLRMESLIPGNRYEHFKLIAENNTAQKFSLGNL